MPALNPVVLAPTTLMRVPPLEYIRIAAECGYDGMGFRLYPSPSMQFYPVVGDATLMNEVRAAVRDTGIKLYDILTCYVTPDMDLEAMKRAHEFGAELGAPYALVIGDDPEWDRMVQNFGTLCDNAAQFGMTCALEAPVNRRALTTLELNLKLIADSGRDNAVISIDPVQFFRSGGTVDDLREVDPRLMPYTQICDATDMVPMHPYCMPGEGIFPLFEMLDVMPQGLPLSLEYHHRDDAYTPRQWAQHVLDGTRNFLRNYYAGKDGK
jgi:sugar phosphate isomerase/epimerase